MPQNFFGFFASWYYNFFRKFYKDVTNGSNYLCFLSKDNTQIHTEKLQLKH